MGLHTTNPPPTSPTHGLNRYRTLPARPPQGPSGTKLSPHAHNQRNPAISREQGEFSPCSTTTPPSRENFLPLPPPRHHSPGTKLSPQHPSPGSTGTKLSRHAQKHRNPAISRVQGEFSPASNTNPPLTRYKTLPATATRGPNRYKTLPARPKTPKSGHFSRAGRIFSRFHHHATEQGELSPASNTNPPLTRYKTLPATPIPGLNRYKTLPARPKTPKSGHFSRAGRIFSRFHHHATEQGELSPASNTNPPLTRYKTLPARPKTPKSGHFSRAGRILSRFQHHLGAYFNAADRLVPTFTRAPDQCAPELGIVRVIGCSSRCSSRTRRD